MYCIGKHSAVLKNATGLARLDAYIYSPVTIGSIGVCLLGKQTWRTPKRCSSCKPLCGASWGHSRI